MLASTLRRLPVLLALACAPLAAGAGPLQRVVPGSPGLAVKQLVRLARP